MSTQVIAYLHISEYLLSAHFYDSGGEVKSGPKVMRKWLWNRTRVKRSIFRMGREYGDS